MAREQTLIQLPMESKDIIDMCENTGKSNPMELFRKSPNSKRKLDYLGALEKRVMYKQDVIPMVRYDSFGNAKYYLIPTQPFGYVKDKRQMEEYGESDIKLRRPITESPHMKLKIGNMLELETLINCMSMPFAEQLMDVLIRFNAKKESKRRAIKDQRRRRLQIDASKVTVKKCREYLQYDGEY